MQTRKKAVDSETQAFERDLLRSVKEMNAGKAANKTKVNVSPVVSARHTSGLSRVQFASVLGISVRTLQKWEQGERKPSGAAKSLIRIAQRHLKVLADAKK